MIKTREDIVSEIEIATKLISDSWERYEEAEQYTLKTGQGQGTRATYYEWFKKDKEEQNAIIQKLKNELIEYDHNPFAYQEKQRRRLEVEQHRYLVTCDRIEESRKRISKFQGCISANGLFNTVGLKTDGTVVVVGCNKNGQCKTKSWRNIVAISSGWGVTVGLKADGTVVAVWLNNYGQCNTENWRDIVNIYATREPDAVLGRKADDTFVAVGRNETIRQDIRDIFDSCALKADDAVVAFGHKTVEWRNIVAVSKGGTQIVGLKIDGSVITVGDNSSGQCNTKNWSNIVTISAGTSHTVGLKADGSVIAVGLNTKGQCNTENWKDIVAISAGNSHTVGLKSDGTVVAVGSNCSGQCDTMDWRNIGPVPEEKIQSMNWRAQGLCQYCGGIISGFFFKKCKSCG